MNKLIPTMYVKNIENINYNKLRSENIKCLIFDLDNTLASYSDLECPERVISLINNLKKDFNIVIVTNSPKKRTVPYKKALNVEIISFAMKPFVKALKKIKIKYNYQKDEMVIIGDQLMTDILAGKNYGIKTILVDPLAEKDLKITKINRIIENRIINKYQKKGLFERGKYYE